MTEKSKILSIRFTPEALDWIVRQAREMGISKGRYIRKIVLGELPPAEVPFATNQRSLKLADNVTNGEMKNLIYQDLPAVSRNVNKIAKKVNSKDEFTDKEREELITEIKSCREVIHQLGRKIMEAIL